MSLRCENKADFKKCPLCTQNGKDSIPVSFSLIGIYLLMSIPLLPPFFTIFEKLPTALVISFDNIFSTYVSKLGNTLT